MSKKSDLILTLAKKIEIPHVLPDAEVEGNMLELGMFAVLQRENSPAKVKSALVSLRKSFEDYNEARVSQVQEIATAISSKGASVPQVNKVVPMARKIKEYLQAVFQETHGLDLEGLIEDPVGVGRALSSIELLGAEITTYLLFVAEKGEMPVLSGSIRVLDRLGAIARTSSVRKARELLDPMIPAKDRLAVAYAMAIVADRWCDSRKPICWECPLLDDCRNGKKVHKEWVIQQSRLAKQREKEEMRQAVQAKKDEARAKREADRLAKIEQAEIKKRNKALDIANRALAKKRELEQKKEDERKQKEADKLAAQKAAAAKKVAAAKAAEQKKAAAKKKAAKKKAAAKKKTAKKTTSNKAPTKKGKVTKKSVTKKSSASTKGAGTKKAGAKKAGAKKKTTSKKVAKKTTAKTASKAKSTKRPKTTTKKTTRRR